MLKKCFRFHENSVNLSIDQYRLAISIYEIFDQLPLAYSHLQTRLQIGCMEKN